MIRMLRALDGVRMPAHPSAAILFAYARGTINAANALARLEALCGAPITGQDLTDLTGMRTNIDAMTVPSIGNATVESYLLMLRKLDYVNQYEKYCCAFEMGMDAVISEAELRNLLNLPL